MTPRSRGTDMSGGAINQSIVLDVSQHMKNLIEVNSEHARVQPGMMYKDFEVENLWRRVAYYLVTLRRVTLECWWHDGNNSGGEKSLEYGKNR